MCEARNREEWHRTSSLLAMLVNVNRDPKRGRPVSPADLNPYARTAKAVYHSSRTLNAQEVAELMERS